MDVMTNAQDSEPCRDDLMDTLYGLYGPDRRRPMNVPHINRDRLWIVGTCHRDDYGRAVIVDDTIDDVDVSSLTREVCASAPLPGLSCLIRDPRDSRDDNHHLLFISDVEDHLLIDSRDTQRYRISWESICAHKVFAYFARTINNNISYVSFVADNIDTITEIILHTYSQPVAHTQNDTSVAYMSLSPSRIHVPYPPLFRHKDVWNDDHDSQAMIHLVSSAAHHHSTEIDSEKDYDLTPNRDTAFADDCARLVHDIHGTPRSTILSDMTQYGPCFIWCHIDTVSHILDLMAATQNIFRLQQSIWGVMTHGHQHTIIDPLWADNLSTIFHKNGIDVLSTVVNTWCSLPLTQADDFLRAAARNPDVPISIIIDLVDA